MNCPFALARLRVCVWPSRCRTVCGSPCYMAPEVNGRGSYAGAPVDLWALGALAYEVRSPTEMRGCDAKLTALEIGLEYRYCSVWPHAH
eukprot:6174665-Pleurochrysis_carterae.AAC.3